MQGSCFKSRKRKKKAVVDGLFNDRFSGLFHDNLTDGHGLLTSHAKGVDSFSQS